jgi:hypothetical protein
MKPAEDGRGAVLRCVNVTGERVAGAWRLGVAAARAWLARLDETRAARRPVLRWRPTPQACGEVEEN